MFLYSIFLAVFSIEACFVPHMGSIWVFSSSALIGPVCDGLSNADHGHLGDLYVCYWTVPDKYLSELVCDFWLSACFVMRRLWRLFWSSTLFVKPPAYNRIQPGSSSLSSTKLPRITGVVIDDRLQSHHFTYKGWPTRPGLSLTECATQLFVQPFVFLSPWLLWRPSVRAAGARPESKLPIVCNVFGPQSPGVGSCRRQPTVWANSCTPHPPFHRFLLSHSPNCS